MASTLGRHRREAHGDEDFDIKVTILTIEEEISAKKALEAFWISAKNPEMNNKNECLSIMYHPKQYNSFVRRGRLLPVRTSDNEAVVPWPLTKTKALKRKAADTDNKGPPINLYGTKEHNIYEVCPANARALLEDDAGSPLDFENSTNTDKHAGSLLRLPKPVRIPEETATVMSTATKIESSVAHQTPGSNATNGRNKEDEKSVLVFVSEYCVVERERFVRVCHGNVSKDQIAFCKSYPPACTSTSDVIPILTYCQSYYRQYPKFCGGSKIANDVLQYCFAFEQFCLPELTPAIEEATTTPRPTVRKCAEVLPEARKVCNPFPKSNDTFNVFRCKNFLANCKAYVDWVS